MAAREVKLIAAASACAIGAKAPGKIAVADFSRAESDERFRRELLPAVWQQVEPQLAKLVAAMGVRSGRREDVLQDVWLAAFERAPPGLGAEDLRRWLVRVAVNRCHLDGRRAGRWRTVWHGLAVRLSHRGAEQHETDPQAASEDRQLVRQALRSLEPETRSLLILRYFLDFDSAEIGRVLGLPDSTVRGRLREARRRLAGELKRAGFEND
jgi:RNA polymerase sigma-70 factor, ECF subfamily